MQSPIFPNLSHLRLALLQNPADPERWQSLVAVIEAMGAGLLLSDLDGLFEQPLPQSAAAALRSRELQQGLEAHRSGDVEGLRRALNRLRSLDAEGAWPHALQGLLAELEGSSGYAAFARALALDSADPWFRYWLSVASLRRRDWMDFSCHALPLADSQILEHQVLVLAAVHHLIAAALVRLMPGLCQANDLRALDLVHPDTIAHGNDEMVANMLRYVDKERRKMIRILISHIKQDVDNAAKQWMLIHQLLGLLRWRVVGLAEPCFSADLFAALQRQLEQLPNRCQQHGVLRNLLPRRPDLVFGDEHVRVWRDFRFTLTSSQ